MRTKLCCVIQSLGSKSEILTKLFFPGCMGGPIIQACFLRNIKHNYPLTDIPTPLNYCLLNLLAYKNNTGDCFTLTEVWIHHKTTFTSRPNLIDNFCLPKYFMFVNVIHFQGCVQILYNYKFTKTM